VLARPAERLQGERPMTIDSPGDSDREGRMERERDGRWEGRAESEGALAAAARGEARHGQVGQRRRASGQGDVSETGAGLGVTWLLCAGGGVHVMAWHLAAVCRRRCAGDGVSPSP
jgi:hypothetical protein